MTKLSDEQKLAKRIARYPRSVEALADRASKISDTDLLKLGEKVYYPGCILDTGYILFAGRNGSLAEFSREDYFMLCEAAERTGMWNE
jgi:hypothetical protein